MGRNPAEMSGPQGLLTGGAWLSSARVVRCWVKSRNERNPRSMLPARDGGDSWEPAGDNSEEGGDDVKSSCPLCLGLQTCYNGRYKGLRYREVERIPKSRSQFGLGSATRPHEVGVASNRRSATLRCTRPRALYTPPVTSRKSVTPEAGGPTPRGREPSKAGSAIGTKCDQGSRTVRCGWIPSFLRSTSPPPSGGGAEPRQDRTAPRLSGGR